MKTTRTTTAASNGLPLPAAVGHNRHAVDPGVPQGAAIRAAPNETKARPHYFALWAQINGMITAKGDRALVVGTLA